MNSVKGNQPGLRYMQIICDKSTMETNFTLFSAGDDKPNRTWVTKFSRWEFPFSFKYEIGRSRLKIRLCMTRTDTPKLEKKGGKECPPHPPNTREKSKASASRKRVCSQANATVSCKHGFQMVDV